MSNPFDVFINGVWVNRVYDQETDPTEVRRSLINHDGYSSTIDVKRGTKSIPQGACWKEEEIQRGYRNRR